MSKISLVFTSALVAASAVSSVAFAAMPSSRGPIAQGAAVNECRTLEEPAMNDHHARLAVDACVQRLTHVNQSRSY